MAAGRELFVYWKVAGPDADAACAAASVLLDALRQADPSLRAHLYRRHGGSDPGVVTVMETYARPGRGLDDAAIASITEAGRTQLGRWAPQGRHVEVFELLPEP